MNGWPDSRFIELAGISAPIIQAPMLGAGADLMIGVAKAGGLGSLACATLTLDSIRAEVSAFREACDQPLNLNFFCHQPPPTMKVVPNSGSRCSRRTTKSWVSIMMRLLPCQAAHRLTRRRVRWLKSYARKW